MTDWAIAVAVGLLLIVLFCGCCLTVVGIVTLVAEWLDVSGPAVVSVVLFVAAVGIMLASVLVFAHDEALPWLRGNL